MPSIVLAEDKPNIVIILTDDQGYTDVSYNPHSQPEVSTPNIDAFAHSSIICTQGYTSRHVKQSREKSFGMYNTQIPPRCLR